MNYYENIKEKLIDVEVTCKVKDYSKNQTIINNYYEVGRLIVEAQGGESKAKYGDKLIKEYSKKLLNELNKKYDERLLRKMRQFYIWLSNKKWPSLKAKLTWSHYKELLPLKDDNKINYYIDLTIKHSLTYRQLHERIKTKEYDRLDDNTKLKLIENKELELVDIIKNPIIIDNPNKYNIFKEKELHKLIMEQLFSFLTKLGEGYAYVGDEFPIKLGDRYNYIDFLLFNVKFNCYVVIELKIEELKKEHIGQIMTYMNYIDLNIKENNNDKTIGIILCYKNNEFIIKYCSDSRIIVREYMLI